MSNEQLIAQLKADLEYINLNIKIFKNDKSPGGINTYQHSLGEWYTTRRILKMLTEQKGE